MIPSLLYHLEIVAPMVSDATGTFEAMELDPTPCDDGSNRFSIYTLSSGSCRYENEVILI
jgi:hypothetical protein